MPESHYAPIKPQLIDIAKSIGRLPGRALRGSADVARKLANPKPPSPARVAELNEALKVDRIMTYTELGEVKIQAQRALIRTFLNGLLIPADISTAGWGDGLLAVRGILNRIGADFQPNAPSLLKPNITATGFELPLVEAAFFKGALPIDTALSLIQFANDLPILWDGVRGFTKFIFDKKSLGTEEEIAEAYQFFENP